MGFSTHGEAKQNGSFSRKHRTNEAHSAVVEANAARFAAKSEGAFRRTQEARRRTPEAQLASLDATFGKGAGAKRERVKLALRIEAAKVKKAAPKAQVPVKTQETKGKTPRR